MNNIRGRFKKEAADIVQQYTVSVDYDWKLYSADIRGSIAHAHMLAKQDIITQDEARQIVNGLTAIEKEIRQGKFVFKPELEDIHMNIEAALIEKIGDAGRKLHTARSRNDQVATDTRLYVLGAIELTVSGLVALQKTIVELAESNLDTVIPGYTHMQRAQPVLLAHHLMAYYEMLKRDIARFNDCAGRADVLPLGSGALAGVAYKIDRPSVAKELGFKDISANSIDAVSDRDFVLEYEFAASVCMMHLSRLAEEIVLWSSAEFGFIELDDSYTTGSSIMPQKKNPDVAELARGKTGRVYGHLMALLTTMKGLPLAYNRDIQEDKEGLFDTVGTLVTTLEVFDGMIKTLRVNDKKTSAAAGDGYMLATDVADYLVGKGESFRKAHEAVGKLVQYAIEKRNNLDQLTLKEYRKFSPLFDESVLAITIESSIAARDNQGGTAKRQIMRRIAVAKKEIQGLEE